VASSGVRTAAYAGVTGRVRRGFDRITVWLRFVALGVVVALVPVMTSDQYFLRVGVVSLIYALLALGLNVSVGLAGLLDLGYVAFYGFGAYGYPMLSSSKFGVHWPTWGSLPVVLPASILGGL